jgi:hypothetical protein
MPSYHRPSPLTDLHIDPIVLRVLFPNRFPMPVISIGESIIIHLNQLDETPTSRIDHGSRPKCHRTIGRSHQQTLVSRLSSLRLIITQRWHTVERLTHRTQGRRLHHPPITHNLDRLTHLNPPTKLGNLLLLHKINY